MSRKPLCMPTSRYMMLKPAAGAGTNEMFAHSSTVARRPSSSLLLSAPPPPPPPPPPSTLSTNPSAAGLNIQSVLTITAETFIYTEDDLKKTPTFVIHEIPFGEEMRLRVFATSWIRELAVKVIARCRHSADENVRQAYFSKHTISTAITYFHRFYMSCSLVTFNPMFLATAALFLAAKVENVTVRLNYFATFVCELFAGNDPVDNDEIDLGKKLIESYESKILCALGFFLQIKTPVEIIYASFVEENLKLVAARLSLDFLQYTIQCLLHNSSTIAAAVILGASIYLNIDMNAQYGSKWYKKIAPDATYETLVNIVDDLSKAYDTYSNLIPKISDRVRKQSERAAKKESQSWKTPRVSHNTHSKPPPRYENTPLKPPSRHYHSQSRSASRNHPSYYHSNRYFDSRPSSSNSVSHEHRSRPFTNHYRSDEKRDYGSSYDTHRPCPRYDFDTPPPPRF